ncbi:MAG: hypothetical protein WC878_08160 [Candidatus Paceibacterota bacterium]|jgi:hypothetical protein
MCVLNTEKLKYPWLAKYLSKEALSELTIVMIPNRNVRLERVNYLTAMFGFIRGLENDYSEVLLLDAEGEKLGRVGEIHYPPKSAAWWKRRRKPYMIFNPNETAEEAIRRLGIKKQVWYILDVTLRKLYL